MLRYWVLKSEWKIMFTDIAKNVVQLIERLNLKKEPYFILISPSFIKVHWKIIYNDYDFGKRYETPEEFIEAIKKGDEYVAGIKVLLDDPKIEEGRNEVFQHAPR